MNSPVIDMLPQLLPQLLAGMATNFEIAVVALLLGLVFGLMLIGLGLLGGVAGGASGAVVGLMRAAPTFVVMFFLLNVIPRNATLFGAGLEVSGALAVALSLVPYSAAYVVDNGQAALLQLRRGSPLAALLFLPSLARAFFVLVMSSGAGAAIGVTEGIAVILRHAEHLPALDDKLLLFAVGIAMFGIPLQLGFALVRHLQHRIGRSFTAERADAR